MAATQRYPDWSPGRRGTRCTHWGSEFELTSWLVSRPVSYFSPLAGIAQLVEHNLAKVGVAGSSPVSRSCPEVAKRPKDPLYPEVERPRDPLYPEVERPKDLLSYPGRGATHGSAIPEEHPSLRPGWRNR